MASGRYVVDYRALSVEDPIDLDDHYRKSWPPFLLDLMPQGRARRQIASHLEINENARSSDLPLLLRAGGNPTAICVSGKPPQRKQSGPRS